MTPEGLRKYVANRRRRLWRARIWYASVMVALWAGVAAFLNLDDRAVWLLGTVGVLLFAGTVVGVILIGLKIEGD